MLFYTVAYLPTFTDQVRGLPKLVQDQVYEKVRILEVDPRPDGKTKRHLKYFKHDINRLRCGDYRVLYDIRGDCVRLTGVRHRKEVYDDDEVEVDAAGLDLSNVVDESELKKPTPRQNWSDVQPDDNHGVDTLVDLTSSREIPPPEPLPVPLEREFLRELGIPPQCIDILIKCQTFDDVIEAPVPEEFRDRVFNVVSTPDYDQVVQGPAYVLDSFDDLPRIVAGDLVNFLLKLDSEQEGYVNWAIRGTGPNLLKGGPGTGKSIVAVYRTRSIILELRKLCVAKPRILFTSYTNALVNTSRQLLHRLLGSDADCVMVRTADSLVTNILRDAGLPTQFADEAIVRAHMKFAREAFEQGSIEDQELAASIAGISTEYLQEEIDGVIFGREHATLASYLAANRSGRRVRLSRKQRRAVWRLGEIRKTRMAKHNHHIIQENRRTALELVRSGSGPEPFDAVLIDEAQDLDPTVIRLLVALCESQDRLFLTADANQSIYGSGFRWADIHSDLRFRGRTGLLRRNYRSTKQIGEAAASYLAGSKLDDDEVEVVEAAEYVRTGIPPLLEKIPDPDAELGALYRFLRMRTRSSRVGLGSCAVLVPDEAVGKAIAFGLNQRGLAAKFMASKDVDLDDPVVKVLTMHTAKGLEFPIVALAGLRANSRLVRLPETCSEEEKTEELNLNRRVLHVAMTRAMRDLLVLLPSIHHSAVLDGFDERYWVIEGSNDCTVASMND